MTCFRPLSGSYISQCKRKTKGENHEQFPSPIGELHFSIDELIPIARDIQCFRPLSGSYISQYEHGNIKDYMCACFRPLSGSYISQSPEQFCQYISDRFRPLSGSYISQSSTHHSAILHYRFPSPIGELHFSIVRNAYWTKKTISVSVPYRGATFLNDVRLRGYDKRTEVSVPYRGATFLNHQWITHPRRMTQFPSPIGELHFSMMCISDVILYRICPSFRPLSGSYISQ